MLAFFSSATSLLGYLGDLPKIVGFIEFLYSSVLELESTTQTGDQKLAGVLNLAETSVAANFPNFSQEFNVIAGDVESVVNAVVGMLNAFKKAGPAT